VISLRTPWESDVTNWIKSICEPKKLILAWQAPDHLHNRYRWAVGVITPAEGHYNFRYLSPGSEFERFNHGKKYASLLDLGYKGYPAFNSRTSEHTHGVLEAFLRRVPPRSRPDFERYRQNFRISPDVKLTDLGLLAVTEAKLPSDGFSVVDMLDPDADNCA
jgi:hypothetical protein